MTTQMVLDYGRSFADHSGGESRARMPIIARTFLTPTGGPSVPFYVLQDHFGEITNVPTGMFKLNPSYHFRPVVSAAHGTILYRRAPDFSSPPAVPYRDLTYAGGGSPWGPSIIIAPEVEADQLTTRTEIAAAKTAGKPVVGRVELPPQNGHSAIIEFPVSMVAAYDDRWHMQAGPCLFPRFDETKPNLIEYLNIANVIFNEFTNFGYAEFLMEDALQIRPEVSPMVRVLHFWRDYARTATVSVWAVP